MNVELHHTFQSNGIVPIATERKELAFLRKMNIYQRIFIYLRSIADELWKSTLNINGGTLVKIHEIRQLRERPSNIFSHMFTLFFAGHRGASLAPLAPPVRPARRTYDLGVSQKSGGHPADRLCPCGADRGHDLAAFQDRSTRAPAGGGAGVVSRGGGVGVGAKMGRVDRGLRAHFLLARSAGCPPLFCEAPRSYVRRAG